MALGGRQSCRHSGVFPKASVLLCILTAEPWNPVKTLHFALNFFFLLNIFYTRRPKVKATYTDTPTLHLCCPLQDPAA